MCSAWSVASLSSISRSWGEVSSNSHSLSRGCHCSQWPPPPQEEYARWCNLASLPRIAGTCEVPLPPCNCCVNFGVSSLCNNSMWVADLGWYGGGGRREHDV